MDKEAKKLLELIIKRLDSMDARFDGIDSRFDGIDSRLDGMDGKLAKCATKEDVQSLRMYWRILQVRCRLWKRIQHLLSVAV